MEMYNSCIYKEHETFFCPLPTPDFGSIKYSKRVYLNIEKSAALFCCLHRQYHADASVRLKFGNALAHYVTKMGNFTAKKDEGELTFEFKKKKW